MKRLRVVSVLMMIFFGFILVGCDFVGAELGENEAKVLNSESTFEGTNYEEVVEKLQKWGFTNIETEAVYDIVWGITKEGSTKSVSIDGSNTFEYGDIFDKDVLIIVTYSMKTSSEPQPVEYEIVWKNEDGSILRTDQIEEGTTPVYIGLEPTKDHSNEKKKYVFNGWTPEISEVEGDSTYTATYLEADNNFTITFDLNGGNWNLENTQMVIYNELITNVEPIKEGYSFEGWETQGIIFKSDFDSQTLIQKDYTLIAKWGEFKHTVTFDLNGGEWSMDNIQKVSPSEYITKNTPAKDWNDFIGWLNNGQVFDPSTPISSDITLTAKWQETNPEDALVGGWECGRALGCDLNPNLAYIEFDGVFVEANGKIRSGFRDIDYNYIPFVIDGYQLTMGTATYTMSYSNGELTLSGSGVYPFTFEKTSNQPNSLGWTWGKLLDFAKINGTEKLDNTDVFYEIEMNLSVSITSPNGIQMVSNQQLLQVYEKEIMGIIFNCIGVEDSTLTMRILIAFDYSKVAESQINPVVLIVNSESYVMEGYGIATTSFNEVTSQFAFETIYLEIAKNTFPTSNNFEFYGYIEIALFNITDYLLRNNNVILLPK